MITEELKSMGAPRLIVEAGQEIEKAVSANLNPPYSMVVFVRNWVTRQRSNDRYGR